MCRTTPARRALLSIALLGLFSGWAATGWASPGGAPDLQISSINGPWTSNPGSLGFFQALVQNIGNATAGNFSVRFLLDDLVDLGNRSVSNLSENGSVWVGSNEWVATTGTHTLRVIADVGDAVQESNETNNERTLTFCVCGQPDLVVAGVTVSPTSLTEGMVARFNATVINRGNASAGPFTVRFLLDGDVFADVPASIQGWGGASANVSSPAWNATAGNHTVRVIADVANDVSESNESNNESARSFSVLARRVLLDESLDAASPTLSVLSVHGHRRDSDGRYYDLQLSAGPSNHTVSVPLGSYVPPINGNITVPSHAGSIRLTIAYAYDPSQFVCAAALDGQCVGNSPLDPNSPGWAADANNSAALFVTIRASVDNQVFAREVRIPLAGQVLAGVPGLHWLPA